MAKFIKLSNAPSDGKPIYVNVNLIVSFWGSKRIIHDSTNPVLRSKPIDVTALYVHGEEDLIYVLESPEQIFSMLNDADGSSIPGKLP